MNEPSGINPPPGVYPPEDQPPSPRQGNLNRIASNTRIITAIWVTSAILNVLFLASIIVLGVGYDHNANALHSQTEALHSANVSQCQANNEDRRQDIAIWNLVEKPTSSRNAATVAKFEMLKRLVQAKDSPRNCVKVYAP